MIQFDVFGITDKIYKYLSEKCAACTLRWKTSTSTDPAEYGEAKPTVYAFTFDDEEIPDTPSVLIQTTNINPSQIHYVIYVSCAHAAVQECETVDAIEGEENKYTYRTETIPPEEEGGEGAEVPATGYTSDGVRRELYKVTLMLGQFVFESLMRMGNDGARIQNLSLIPPSAFMQEFPYCSCSLEFDALYESMPKAVATTRLQELL
jgi:hypothetical protein